jgi:hypothetical protein
MAVSVIREIEVKLIHHPSCLTFSSENIRSGCSVFEEAVKLGVEIIVV